MNRVRVHRVWVRVNRVKVNRVRANRVRVNRITCNRITFHWVRDECKRMWVGVRVGVRVEPGPLSSKHRGQWVSTLACPTRQHIHIGLG